MMTWLPFSLSIILLFITLLPYISKAHGLVRIFDFPRIQITTISACLLAFSILQYSQTPDLAYVIGFSLITICIHLFYIARFSLFWRKRSKAFVGDIDKASQIRLLICNVKQSNRDFDRLLALVEDTKPDVAIFMEVDDEWDRAITPIFDQYPHHIKNILNNTYGIALVSKFKLKDETVRFLLNPEVPSIDTMIEHPKGGEFRVFALHPEPPLPHQDTIGRDAEIAFVGNIARNDGSPIIVCGDLNDVAWSATTRRFLRISRLLDPREGRGMFNTFDARFFFIRWPLDHIFHSPHFQLISMKRMRNIGSDHFPMLYDLALTDSKIGNRRTDNATTDELNDAQDLIEIERDRDRRPAGHDWEDGA